MRPPNNPGSPSGSRVWGLGLGIWELGGVSSSCILYRDQDGKQLKMTYHDTLIFAIFTTIP